jgi:hypothetical protein
MAASEGGLFALAKLDQDLKDQTIEGILRLGEPGPYSYLVQSWHDVSLGLHPNL